MNDSALCLSSECCHLLLSSISLNHHEATGKSKSGGGPRDPAGAVIYTICIITLFSSLIILLMVRAIKPREDEQVTSVLCNMRVRVDREELRRRQNQMREAKKSAQKWLGQLKSRRLSFRRANSGVSTRDSRHRRTNPWEETSQQNSLQLSDLMKESFVDRSDELRQSSVFSYDEEMDPSSLPSSSTP